MVLVHDAPLAVDLAQTHGQSKFENFPLAARIEVNAISYRRGKGDVLASNDVHIVKVKSDGPLRPREENPATIREEAHRTSECQGRDLRESLPCPLPEPP